MASRYLLTGPVGGQYRFVLKAANGETILNSERYTSKANALGGIQSVRTNSPLDERYVRKNAINEQPMFNLKATNGEIIGTSETYSTPAAREAGIASTKVNGPTAPLDDQTTA